MVNPALSVLRHSTQHGKEKSENNICFRKEYPSHKIKIELDGMELLQSQARTERELSGIPAARSFGILEIRQRDGTLKGEIGHST